MPKPPGATLAMDMIIRVRSLTVVCWKMEGSDDVETGFQKYKKVRLELCV